MQRILAKRVGRNLKKNFPRYLALMLLITVSLFLVVSITVPAETVIRQSGRFAEQDKVEDGQFTVFIPLSEEAENELKDDGITLERMFFTDYLLEDEDTLRLFKDRKEINLLRLVEGEKPKQDDEIVLERRFCEENDYKTGDKIKVGNKTFNVTGVATALDYEAPLKSVGDSTVTSDTFGIGWVTDETYDSFTKENEGEKSEEYVYAYRLNDKMTSEELKKKIQDFPFAAENVDDEYFQEFWDETIGKKEDVETAMSDLADGAGELTDGLDDLVRATYGVPVDAMGLGSYVNGVASARDGSQELEDGIVEFRDEIQPVIDEVFSEIEIDNLEMFLKAEDNPRIGSGRDDFLINRSSALFAGVIIMILFAYVLTVFVTHEIERDGAVIGTLYALGVKKKDLLIHYLHLPVLTTLISSVIGLILGTSGKAVGYMMTSSLSYYSMPNLSPKCPVGLMIYALVMPVVIVILVNCMVISKKLNKPALGLIKGETKQPKVSRLKLKHFGFVNRFRIRQLVREFRSAITVVLGIFIAYLLLMMSLDIYAHCGGLSVKNREDIRFNYMYTYKYPENEVPKGGTEVCGTTCQMESMGYKMDVTLMGIDEDNPYFDLDLASNSSDVTISDSMASKFGLKVGDEFVVEDSSADRNYAFTVKDIINYSPSFFVFMDIDEMREMMDVDEDYFNIVLSDKELDIPKGRLYNEMTSKDIIKASDVFITLMNPMIYMMLTMSIVVFVMVMYLMLRMMIDRSSKNISLFRVFGYRTGEIRKLYLDGNFVVVAIGAAIFLPLSKFLMDLAYPYLCSNVASGLDTTFPGYYYPLIYIVTLLLYVIIDVVLMRRIKKIMPAEVLANRE